MPATSHNIVAIPLQRAELYGRIGPEDDYATASTVDLVCTQITVEVNVIELGLITLAAGAALVLMPAGRQLSYIHEGNQMTVVHDFLVGERDHCKAMPLHTVVSFDTDDIIESMLIRPWDQSLFDEALKAFLA